MAFNDVSKSVKEQLAEVMKDQNISDEVLGKLTGVLNNINELDKQHQEVVDKCDKCIEIPQFGTKHSLNVSVTAGLVIWDFFKQLYL